MNKIRLILEIDNEKIYKNVKTNIFFSSENIFQNIFFKVDFPVLHLFVIHIVCLTIWHQLFLQFWLVKTCFFTHWRHQLYASQVYEEAKSWVSHCHIGTLYMFSEWSFLLLTINLLARLIIFNNCYDDFMKEDMSYVKGLQK